MMPLKVIRKTAKTTLKTLSPRLFKRWKHRQLARSYQRASLVYIHIAKAGGTSITAPLFRHPVGHRSIRQVQSICPKQVEQFPVFTVVRNPWDRLYSAYNHARQGGGSDTDVSPRFDYTSQAFSTFDSFIVNWLQAQENIGSIDMIFRAQKWFLGGSESIKLFDHIGRLEDLGPTVSWIEAQSGRKIEIQHRNRTSPVAASGEIEVSQQAWKIVHNLYQADFELLQYPFDLPHRFRLTG